MPKTIVIGYDGSKNAESALDFAVKEATERGAKLVVAHILEWSPYSFLTPTELEERQMRRREELRRAEDALLKPVVKKLDGSGVDVSTELKYGNIAEVLITIAEEHKAAMIVIGRRGNSRLSGRLFGSVAGTLAQAATVPAVIVP